MDGLLHLLAALPDLRLHHPVRHEAVEEVVRELQEAAHVDVQRLHAGYVGHLAAEAAQACAGLLDLPLSLVHLPVLHHRGEKAAAEHVPEAPAAGAGQAPVRPAQRLQRVVRRADRLVDLLLILHISHDVLPFG